MDMVDTVGRVEERGKRSLGVLLIECNGCSWHSVI